MIPKAEIKRLETAFDALAEQHDDLVRQVLDGIVILESMEVKDAVLELLLAEARQGFIGAARTMIGGNLDLFSERGLAEARKVYNEVTRYREMISWIMEALRRAHDAAEGLPFVEQQMRDDIEPFGSV